MSKAGASRRVQAALAVTTCTTMAPPIYTALNLSNRKTKRTGTL
jgi:hypothetical protein